MLDEDERHAGVRGQAPQEGGERFQSSRGSAESDDREAGATLLPWAGFLAGWCFPSRLREFLVGRHQVAS
jgi:hypothetical protein